MLESMLAQNTCKPVMRLKGGYIEGFVWIVNGGKLQTVSNQPTTTQAEVNPEPDNCAVVTGLIGAPCLGDPYHANY